MSPIFNSSLFPSLYPFMPPQLPKFINKSGLYFVIPKYPTKYATSVPTESVLNILSYFGINKFIILSSI